MIKHIRFNPDTKLSDMILANYMLLTILPRFNIELGFGDRTVAKICGEQGIDRDFFLMVCNLHSFDGYIPTKEELLHTNPQSVVEYLKQSHNYYVNTRIAAIEVKLDELSTLIDINHYVVLTKFFLEYKREVLNHFEYEEREVFPYVQRLIDGNAETTYNINKYEENHDDIEDKLNDLKNILLKYLPSSSSSQLRFDVLQDIFQFEDDLDKHIRIEDRVLTPIAKRMEELNGK